jgi:O-methyltransferase
MSDALLRLCHRFPRAARSLTAHLRGWWQANPVERSVRTLYVSWIRPQITDQLHRQRLKLIWFIWGYWPLMTLNTLSLSQRIRLLLRFLSVDWHVVHSHRPNEIARVCRALAERRAISNETKEVMIEAGCWQGGSAVKFSTLCKLLGYDLHIYDSFEGVEDFSPEERPSSYDFSGEYAAPEAVLWRNLSRYGEAAVCTVHKGWFIDTLARGPVPYAVRVAFIDCDLAKGTYEVLLGVVPSLVEDGWIFSQDFHIPPVQALLRAPATWERLGKPQPKLTRLGVCLTSLRFRRTTNS